MRRKLISLLSYQYQSIEIPFQLVFESQQQKSDFPLYLKKACNRHPSENEQLFQLCSSLPQLHTVNSFM